MNNKKHLSIYGRNLYLLSELAIYCIKKDFLGILFFKAYIFKFFLIIFKIPSLKDNGFLDFFIIHKNNCFIYHFLNHQLNLGIKINLKK